MHGAEFTLWVTGIQPVTGTSILSSSDGQSIPSIITAAADVKWPANLPPQPYRMVNIDVAPQQAPHSNSRQIPVGVPTSEVHPTERP